MPTPSGKLKRGDIIQNTKTGAYWRVLERVGNDVLYSVKLVPTNPKNFRAEDRQRGYMLMTEAAYWLKNGWVISKNSA